MGDAEFVRRLSEERIGTQEQLIVCMANPSSMRRSEVPTERTLARVCREVGAAV